MRTNSNARHSRHKSLTAWALVMRCQVLFSLCAVQHPCDVTCFMANRVGTAVVKMVGNHSPIKRVDPLKGIDSIIKVVMNQWG